LRRKDKSRGDSGFKFGVGDLFKGLGELVNIFDVFDEEDVVVVIAEFPGVDEKDIKILL